MAFTVCALLLTPGPASALDPGPNDVYVRVVDVGSGLCTVTEIPGGHYMVYDAGHWTGSHCSTAVQDIVDGETIDLLVISHSDGDHLGESDEILGRFDVQRIIRTGVPRTSTAWTNLDRAAGTEAETGASIMNLQTMSLVPGTTIQLGEATVTMVAGWGRWDGPGLSDGELKNVVSVVVRLTYQGNSILFAGDTVGRHIGDPDTVCEEAEKVMFDNRSSVPISSDMMIASHHGADNGSSLCFVEAVNPTFVIFSAGSKDQWGYPTVAAVNRYLSIGVLASNIFRTDRGDDEPGSVEWKNDETVTGCNDGRGDDDIEIVLPHSGPVLVDYRLASTGS